MRKHEGLTGGMSHTRNFRVKCLESCLAGTYQYGMFLGLSATRCLYEATEVQGDAAISCGIARKRTDSARLVNNTRRCGRG